MKVNGKHYRTVWLEGSSVKMIDQPKLPHSFEIISLPTHKETAKAISTMIVRGAGAIGVTGAAGMAQAAIEAADISGEYDKFLDYVETAAETLRNTRPTAQNLFYAIDRVLGVIKSHNNVDNAKQAAIKEALLVGDEDSAACKKIGEFGSVLIGDVNSGGVGKKNPERETFNILTHCNAGWLAFADWGSALSPVYAAVRAGKKVFVFADETRPRCQGARLTAWELASEGVPHAVIADNASGHYIYRGEVDMVIVGADRIAVNGDVANKIGTYEKAVVAKENGVPFYVAAPLSTFDVECKSGAEIPIEERSEDEVLYMFGKDDNGRHSRVRIAPMESTARNPAFDVTPAKYIKGIITEKGIIEPNEENIRKLFSNSEEELKI